jgi:hypothetical protein
MINKTHKIVSVEGKRTGFTESSMVQSVVGKSFRFVMASRFAIWQLLLKPSNDKSMSAWYASYIAAT